jgi:hypothetical protein
MQTSQGYSFYILQHFATKFCNFNDFNKFFTGIYFFLPKSKISLTCKLSINLADLWLVSCYEAVYFTCLGVNEAPVVDPTDGWMNIPACSFHSELSGAFCRIGVLASPNVIWFVELM